MPGKMQSGNKETRPSRGLGAALSIALLAAVGLWAQQRWQQLSKRHIPVYIINLKSRPDRLDDILSKVQTRPPPQIITAIDGRTLPPSTTSLTRGEIGCFKSHIKALEAIASGPHQYGLILEDDADILLPKAWTRIYSALDECPSDWGAVSLGCNYFPRKHPSATRLSEHIFALNGSYLLGAHAMIYTRSAARAYLSEIWSADFDYWIPWDLWLSRSNSPSNLYIVHPAIVLPARFDPANPFVDSATHNIR